MPPEPRVVTWQVHGNYMYYLSQVPVRWLLVTRPGHPPGYAGRTPSFDWPDNVEEVPADALSSTSADCVLYQCRRNWEEDREQLAPAHRDLPAIFLEHDPPQEHPTGTTHFTHGDVDLLVHVTPFNALMWDNADARVRVIEHTAIVDEQAPTTLEYPRGLVVVNHLARRGRRLGHDIYLAVRRQLPLDLAGMDSCAVEGGIGEIPNRELPVLMGRYRFLFNPIRWTSLGLSVVEAMRRGVPIVGLATTELSTVIINGRNGWVDTNVERLVEVMELLLQDRGLAARWGEGARRTAAARFGTHRFVREWQQAFAEVLA
jgi:hypothetical protein